MKFRILTILLLTSGVFIGFGCNMNNPFSSKKPPAPAGSVSAPPHQGFYLTVVIDGKKTQQGDMDNGAQIWFAPKCSRVPYLQFSLDPLALGKIQGDASLTIYPVIQDKVDLTNFFVYSGEKKLQPGRPIKMDRFTHFHNQIVDPNLTALPAGRYRIALKAQGDKDNQWDRQYIDVTIK